MVALPYPTPEGWLPDAQYFPNPVIWATGGVAVAVGVASALLIAVGSLAWGVVLAVAFGMLGVLAAGFGLFATHRRPPQLINANTLSGAMVRPVDDWVHYFRERPAGAWVRTWLGFSGLGTALLLGLAMPGVLAAPGGAWWLLFFVPVLVGCVVLVVYGVTQLAIDIRNSSFGQAPVGLAIGRHGVSRYLLAGATWVPWEAIAEVQAYEHSRVVLVRRDGAPDLEVSAGVFEQDAVLLYCAVRFYVEHPELRDELGTTLAQQRFVAWDRSLGARTV